MQTPETSTLQAVDAHQGGNAHSSSQSATTMNSTKPEPKAWTVALRWSRRGVRPTSGPDSYIVLTMPEYFVQGFLLLRTIGVLRIYRAARRPSRTPYLSICTCKSLPPFARKPGDHVAPRFCRSKHPEAGGRGYSNRANSRQRCCPHGRLHFVDELVSRPTLSHHLVVQEQSQTQSRNQQPACHFLVHLAQVCQAY